MEEENCESPRRLSKDEQSDLSHAVRKLGYKGPIMQAAARYRERQASLGRAAELAGLPVGRMIKVLAAYGVES